MISAWCRGNVFEEAVCNQNLSRVYIRASGNMHGRSTTTKRARRSGTHIWQRWRTRRQSWWRCNSQEGSEAERLSVEVACRSNGRRETGGIKLLQTITFNEKVNATSRGLAQTWMQMCRRRVISKQSSPPTYRLLFLLPFLLLLLLILHIVAAFLPRRRPRETKQPALSFCAPLGVRIHRCLCTREHIEYMEYTIAAGIFNNRQIDSSAQLKMNVYRRY